MLITRIICFLILVAACHLTRFQNTAYIEFTKNEVKLNIHNSTYKVPYNGEDVKLVSVQMQKNLLMENYIPKAKFTNEKEVIYEFNSDCFYIFGRCIFGSPLRAKYQSFQPSYSDWTMDGKNSNTLIITNKLLVPDFKAEMTFLGRGDQMITFTLSNNKNIFINITDGYINNAGSICLDGDCRENGFNEEPTNLNLIRIFNFFAEAFLAGFIFYWFVLLISAFSKAKIKEYTPKFPFKPAVIFTVLLHFSLASYYTVNILGSVPHISDSAIYYRQAVLLSHGTTKTAHLPSEPFKAFQSNSSELVGDQIKYNHANTFWPAMLAIPMKLGAAEYLNPLLSALTALMIYFLASAFFSRAVGLIASFIFAVSPYSIINAGDFMMHSAVQCLFISGLVIMIGSLKEKRAILSFIAAVLIAYAFAIRQLSIFSMLLPAALLCLYYRKSFNFKIIGAAFSGAFIIAILFILDNYYLTGEWFLLAHKKFHNLSIGPGFINLGSNWTDANLASMSSIVFGSYIPQFFMGIVVFCLIYKPQVKTWIFFLFFTLLTLAHLFVPVHGLHGYGARFFYDSFFALCILAGVSISQMYDLCGRSGRLILSILFSYCLIQNIIFGIKILPYYGNYNSINPSLIKRIKEAAKPHTIFLIDGDLWQAMDQTVSIFDPTFEKIIVINQMKDGSHQSILDKFPDWDLYRIDYLGMKKVER